jgi:hypothetical protein
MTAPTERTPATPRHDLTGEAQKGTARTGTTKTARAEHHRAAPQNNLAGESPRDMTKKGTTKTVRTGPSSAAAGHGMVLGARQ